MTVRTLFDQARDTLNRVLLGRFLADVWRLFRPFPSTIRRSWPTGYERYGLEEKPEGWNDAVLGYFHSGPELRDSDTFRAAFAERARQTDDERRRQRAVNLGHEPDCSFPKLIPGKGACNCPPNPDSLAERHWHVGDATPRT